MEFSLEEKQNYLREEILEQGYNEEEFAKFFEEENKPTEELNEIPLSELQSLVAKFKSNHSPKRSQINQTQFQKSQINQSQLQRSPINQTQFTQNDSNNNEMNISTIISSTIYDINPKPPQNTLCKLHNKTKNIIVLDPSKKTNYYFLYEWQYKIYYEAKESMVVRNYSDFTWLRDRLIKNYPGLYVPPIPISNLASGESESILFTLTSFMNAVFDRTIFAKSKLLEDFICLPENEFKKVQEKYTKSREIYTIDESTTNLFKNALEKCTKGNNVNSLVSKISDEINNKTNAFDKLESTFRKIAKEMNVMKDLFKELTKNYEQLIKCVSNSNNKEFSEYFLERKNVFEEWSFGYSNQHKFFTEEFGHFYHYMKKEYNEYKNKIDSFHQTVLEFEQMKTKEISHSETEQITNKFNFHSIFIINEYKSLLKRQLKRLKTQNNEWKKTNIDFHNDYKRFIKLIS